MIKIKSMLPFLAACFVLSSCEDKIEKVGDFNLKSQLEVVQVYDSLGTSYPVEVLRSVDTTYMYPKIKRDTLKDATGKPALDAQNKLQIKLDTTWIAGQKTARFIELDTIVLSNPKSALRIDLKSNARWQAPTPGFGSKIAWYQTLTGTGGGDGTMKIKVLANTATKRRPLLAKQFIFTRDSMVLYKLVFDQKSKNEQ